MSLSSSKIRPWICANCARLAAHPSPSLPRPSRPTLTTTRHKGTRAHYSHPPPPKKPHNPFHPLRIDQQPPPPPSSHNAPDKSHLTAIPPTLSYHWHTTPPTSSQLHHSSRFFNDTPPTFLWSSPSFHAIPRSPYPEVCFLGRSNVGKSSLLNALLGRRALAHVSSKPGRTKTMNAFGVGSVSLPGPKASSEGLEHNDNPAARTEGLVVLDMPGYAHGSREAWGEQIRRYLSKRTQLRRAFLLIDSTHGVKPSDLQILEMFRAEKIPFQIILSKVDRLLFNSRGKPGGETALMGRLHTMRKVMDEVREVVDGDDVVVEGDEDAEQGQGMGVGEILACSAEKSLDGRKMGIDEVRFAMLRACGLEMRDEAGAERRRKQAQEAAKVEIVPHDVVFGFSD